MLDFKNKLAFLPISADGCLRILSTSSAFFYKPRLTGAKLGFPARIAFSFGELAKSIFFDPPAIISINGCLYVL